MKVVLLAGGFGSRLSEETEVKPKPMVEIGGRPILWHIMKHFSHYGHREFIIALGYKGEVVKRYFIDYFNLTGNISLNTREGVVSHHSLPREDWVVHLVDTGISTMTGGRLRQLAPLLHETFLMTYGDGVSDVDLDKLVAFHRKQGCSATVTAVHSPPRFGGLVIDCDDRVTLFAEKATTNEGWINGGYFVIEPRVLDVISGDEVVFEREPLEYLTKTENLLAYRHEGFWQCMDTLRDRRMLEELWATKPPWKIWE